MKDAPVGTVVSLVQAIKPAGVQLIAISVADPAERFYYGGGSPGYASAERHASRLSHDGNYLCLDRYSSQHGQRSTVTTKGPDVGTPTKVTPSVDYTENGYVGGAMPAAQQENYRLNLVSQWFEYLNEKSAAMLSATGDVIASNNAATLNIDDQDPITGFSVYELVSDEGDTPMSGTGIIVPAVGRYQLSLSAAVTSPALYSGALSIYTGFGRLPASENSNFDFVCTTIEDDKKSPDYVTKPIYGAGIITITDPATEPIFLVNRAALNQSGALTPVSPEGFKLALERID